MAKVLVAYASRLGGTRGIAEAIAKGLQDRGHDATAKSVLDVGGLEGFDAIVLGSGVFANHWHKPALEFGRRHEAALKQLPLWLFSSGPVGNIRNPGPLADPKDVAALREGLRPRDHQIFWGSLDRAALDHSNLGVFSRFLGKRVIPEGDWRDWPAIDAWAAVIAAALRRDAPVAV